MKDVQVMRRFTATQPELSQPVSAASDQRGIDLEAQLAEERRANFQRVCTKYHLRPADTLKFWALCDQYSRKALRRLMEMLQTPHAQNVVKAEAKSRFGGSFVLASLDIMKKTQLKAQQKAEQEYIKEAESKFGWLTRPVVVCEGMLTKRARNKKKKSNWKKRFCKLIKCAPPRYLGPYLEYYADAAYKNRKGVVQLKSDHRVQFWNGDAKKQHCFNIYVSEQVDDPDLVAEATSHADAERWVKAIEDCIGAFAVCKQVTST